MSSKKKPEEQQPKEDDAPEGAQDAPEPHAEQVEEVRKALKSFPTLEEGYVHSRGVFFDRAAAELSLPDGEELIIVPSPNKK